MISKVAQTVLDGDDETSSAHQVFALVSAIPSGAIETGEMFA